MTIESLPVPPMPPYPNNRWPLLVYRGALEAEPVRPEAFESGFASRGWVGSWRNGVYDFHHFHSSAHEVLGCYAGRATVRFGGPDGIDAVLEAGDAVVVPAGVAHALVSRSPDFRVVGAYPRSTTPDLLRGDPARYEEHGSRSREVPVPPRDPVAGDGGIPELWRMD